MDLEDFQPRTDSPTMAEVSAAMQVINEPRVRAAMLVLEAAMNDGQDISIEGHVKDPAGNWVGA